MASYTYFSGDMLLPLAFLIAAVLSLLVLIAPLLVFYWVFRDPGRRETDYKTIRKNAGWLSFVCIMASLGILTLIRSGLLFEGELAANRSLFLAMCAATLGLIFGVLSYSRWQALMAAANFFPVWIIILFLG